MKLKLVILLILTAFGLKVGVAQDEGKTNAGDLARELANPNATRGQLFNNFDYIRYSGDIPDAGQNAFVYSFQPVE